jgi:hypothetical protein
MEAAQVGDREQRAQVKQFEIDAHDASIPLFFALYKDRGSCLWSSAGRRGRPSRRQTPLQPIRRLVLAVLLLPETKGKRLDVEMRSATGLSVLAPPQT